MAEYFLVPYRVTVCPKGNPNEPRKMGQLVQGSGLSVVDLVANTLLEIQNLQEPLERPNDENRLLDVNVVKRSSNQVLAYCKVGVKGLLSQLDLSEISQQVIRRYQDAEWFKLRVFFMTSPGQRAGLLAVERTGSYGLYSHLSELLRVALRKNVSDQLQIHFDPIRDIATMGVLLDEITTQAIEFRTVEQSDNIDVNASGGQISLPFAEGVGGKLRKVTRYSQRGGLGKFGKYRGKTPDEMAKIFGYVKSAREEVTEVIAAVKPENSSEKKIKMLDESAQSVTFLVERAAPDNPPTEEELFKTIAEIIEGAADSVGITGETLDTDNLFNDVVALSNAQSWSIHDEPSPQ